MASYEIPVDFKGNLPEIPQNLTYDEELDPRRTEFNPMKVLRQRHLCISVPKQPRVDNVNKFSTIMIGKHRKDIPLKELLTLCQGKSVTKKEGEGSVPSERYEHTFDRLAREACKRKREDIESSEDTVGDDIANKSSHPMQTLLHAYNNRKFIRVLIRKVNGIRGHMDGSLVAFDKHFNIILRDAVEHYEKYVESKEGETTQSETVTRSLPLVLVRGDNVVLVSEAPEKVKTDGI